MSTAKQLLIVIGSTVITALLVLGLARLPIAAPLAVGLHVTAERWVAEPFETRLQRELDQMIYQQHRPMLYQLVMLQMAEQARLTRLRIIMKSRTRPWDGSDMAAPGTHFGIGRIDAKGKIVTPAKRFESPQPDQSDHSLLIALVGFLFTISWILARKV